MLDEVDIRLMRPADLEFVMRSWLNAYKHASSFARRIKNSVYYKWHHKIITGILLRKTTLTYVAVLREDSDTILGFLTFEEFDNEQVVHFCYVKKDFRKMGLCRSLLNDAEVELKNACFTHWTYPVDEMIRKYPSMIYDPYRI